MKRGEKEHGVSMNNLITDLQSVAAFGTLYPYTLESDKEKLLKKKNVQWGVGGTDYMYAQEAKLKDTIHTVGEETRTSLPHGERETGGEAVSLGGQRSRSKTEKSHLLYIQGRKRSHGMV